MGFFIFLIAVVFSGAMMGNARAGFLIGLLSYFLYEHGKRITALEKQRGLAANPQPHSETSAPVVTPAIKASTERETKATITPVIPQNAASSAQKAQATPVRPAAPSKSTEDSLASLFGPAIANFLTHGNPIARIGAVILFLGVGFALKFAADNSHFPPELRLVAAALLSIALLTGGWKMRHRRQQFAIILQGTGIGIFYITTFVAYNMYNFIPSSLTFIFFVAITILSGILALVGNTRSIAVLAMIGGFLAPILASDGGGNHITLFSYITLLNLGIFAMCKFRSWRSLNLTGFLFTFFISATWAEKFYQPEMYTSCQFFLILFAVLYTLINLSYSIKQSNDSVDSLMTFGTPVLYSLLQWRLVEPFEYGTAISSASFGAFHIITARILFSKFGEKLRMLVESYLTIGIILLTLAIPFTFDGRVSSAILALEAAALIWDGIRQKRFSTRALGLILLPLASILFLFDTNTYTSDIGFFNQYFLGIFLLTAGHLASGALLLRAQEGVLREGEKQLATFALWCAGIWWALGGYYEVLRHIDHWHAWLFANFEPPFVISPWTNQRSFNASIYSLFATLSILGFWGIFNRLKLPGKSTVHRLLIPVHCYLLAEFSARQFFGFRPEDTHLLAIAGIFSWPLFFVVHYLILYREEKQNPKYAAKWQHQIGLWLFIYVATLEIRWLVARFTSAGWIEGAIILVPALCTLLVCSKIRKAERWPFSSHAALYCSALWLPVWWSMSVSFLFDFISSCHTAPLPYIPLLNALDLAQAATVIALITWTIRMSKLGKISESQRKTTYSVLGVWSFVWATSTLLRLIHHTRGTPWEFDRMFDSNFVQAALSIFWSVLALTLMLLSHSKGWRELWKSGALLIGAVVVKLFIIDLSSHGTVSRIAAFLGVGLLMLSIGYLAPIPPEKKSTEKQDFA